MTKFIATLLALAFATLANLASAATPPSDLKSMQPFQRFAKGAGEGYALEYAPRNKAQFAALLRGDKKKLRVPCEVIVRQMVEAHPGLPFEGCEGAAAAIEKGDDFAVVACQDQMLQRGNLLAVTNKDGSAFGAWHRACLPGEMVLTYKGQSIVSTTCGNPLIPVAAPAALQPIVTGVCPSGFAIIANAWSLRSLGGLRKEAEELVAAANARESDEGRSLTVYQPPSVSRTLGARLRADVKVRAQVSGNVLQVRYLDPKTAKVVRELGTMTLIQGVGTFRFSDDPREYVVETVWPREFVSPTVSGNERRLRVFPSEWGKFCSMNTHGISLP